MLSGSRLIASSSALWWPCAFKQWADRQGVSYTTARRWFAAGRLPVPARRVGGLILVGESAGPELAGLVTVYARVSSADQKADLDRQVARMTAWAAGEGLPVGKVVTEVGSALNDKRRKFLALLCDQSVTTIVVEHRDRFARFGAEYRHLLIVMHPEGTVAEKVPSPRALRSALSGLRAASRALSRKTEGSPRWLKAKRRLGRVQARIACIHSDAIHQATAHLAKTHGTVVIEDLGVIQLAGGLRSHRKAWIDASAGELRRQLEYKTDWYACELWAADQFYPSSKTCSACGHVNAGLTLSDRRWACPVCGTEHDREENAGTNLARLPASQAEARSGGKTGPARRVAVKRVNHLGKVPA